MSCIYNNSCGKICSHFVVTTAVAFTDGNLVLTLPDDVTYGNREKFCIVIGQTIPDTTTFTAPVVAVIGDGTTQFPLLTRCGTPVIRGQISTRVKYPTVVRTTATAGSFTVLRDLMHVDTTNLNALNSVVEGGA